MNKLKNISVILLTLFIVVSCKDYDEFQNDPNRTTEATPGLLLTNIQISTLNSISLGASMAMRHLVNVNLVEDAQYYGWDRAGFGFYNNLRQVQRMELEAERLGNDNFIALSKFFKAYIYEQITRQFGDIPFSESMRATEGIYFPVYDSQEEIYIGIFELLEEANLLLDVNGPSINGDVVFDGDLLRWKKLINSFHLRVLLSLSKKETSPIGPASRFSSIYNNPSQYPIMQSEIDNCFFSYSEDTGNVYPFWRSASITTSYILEESFVERLKSLEDPRLFSMASPDNNSLNEDPFSFESYSGLKGSAPLNENVLRLSAGEGSRLNQRYVEDAEAEVNLSFSYAELNFILAEASFRGWIDASFASFYEEGIRASMNFYNVDVTEVETYLNNSNVQLQPNTALAQILQQKHISMFLNSGWEPFYDNRRTGFPEFNIDGGAIINPQGIPKRWMYPLSEVNQNRQNLEDAIQRQFSGNDNINEIMWSIQP